jgi:hypothetical protein
MNKLDLDNLEGLSIQDKIETIKKQLKPVVCIKDFIYDNECLLLKDKIYYITIDLYDKVKNNNTHKGEYKVYIPNLFVSKSIFKIEENDIKRIILFETEIIKYLSTDLRRKKLERILN